MNPAHVFPMSTLDTRHLKLVCAIAMEGSVTRAARHLFLSQSAVSHQLIELERDLGVQLFHRIGKRMVPSARGEALIKASERLLNELAQVESEVRDVTQSARETLRVTTACYTSYRWLPAALSGFEGCHPNVDVRIVVEATRRAMDALMADEVDLAILSTPPQSTMWECAPLTTSELVVLSSLRHRWPTERSEVPRGAKKRDGGGGAGARRRKKGPLMGAVRPRAVRAEDLAGAILFVHEMAPEDMSALETGLKAAKATAEIRRVPLTEALAELVRADHGIAIVDRWMIEHHLGKELIAMPLRPKVSRPFYAVWRRANPRALPLKELAKLIQEGF